MASVSVTVGSTEGGGAFGRKRTKGINRSFKAIGWEFTAVVNETEGFVFGHDWIGFVVRLTRCDIGRFNPRCFQHTKSRPRTVGKERACVANVPSERSDEVAGECDALAVKGTVLGQRGFTRSLEDTGFFRGERTARGLNRVVVRHRPNVSENETGFSNGLAVEGFITSPRNST